ncbi:two-component system response regulator, OmpR family [Arcobacter acticola]|jgi:two-component system response regulator VanR|uniref:Two-component system response regulator, OmpR family n=1 Tax=Arcobacter acticola TaxID=1849015 RepID=A0A6M8EEK9_9BACT|nr:response regulator transcription factor [Arcobacter acticola]QKE28422.1 two-component system response regulator, OmpR family [Arcobacter acticola]
MITLESYKKQFNILYVEDDVLFTPKIKYILEKSFKSVLIASNGEEALELFKINKIDLIISDINMPKMDGLTFLKKLRELHNDIPFIFLTARQEANTIIDAIQFDISNYILKPIDLKNFLSIVDKSVKKSYKKYIEIEKKYIIEIDTEFFWNQKTKTLSKNNLPIKLTKKELLLLELLLNYNNKVYSISEIACYLWDEDSGENDYVANLKNIISRLRNKIPEINIENVYGLGYMIKITK